MTRAKLRSIRAYYYHDMAPRSVARHNLRAWVRSVTLLGDKWLMHSPINVTTHAACRAHSTNQGAHHA